MIRPTSVLMVACLLSYSSFALAQSAPVAAGPASAPSAMSSPSNPALPMNRDSFLEQQLEADPEYQSARTRKRAGIVVASVGAGVGAAVMIVAAVSYGLRGLCIPLGAPEGHGSCPSPDATGEKIAAGIGGGLLLAGLAAGIPLINSGATRMQRIREHYAKLVPVPLVNVGPQQAVFGATWRF